MTIEIGWPAATLGALLLAATQFLIGLWISERFKATLQRENNALLEKLRWDFKVKEQAAKVAGYMSAVRNLTEKSDPKDYERANALGWELATWLPSDTYRSLTKAIVGPDSKTNILSVVVDVRKILLAKDAGDIESRDIMFHQPGVGKKALVRARHSTQTR